MQEGSLRGLQKAAGRFVGYRIASSGSPPCSFGAWKVRVRGGRFEPTVRVCASEASCCPASRSPCASLGLRVNQGSWEDGK